MKINTITIEFTNKEICGVASEILTLIDYYLIETNFKNLQDVMHMIGEDLYMTLSEIVRLGNFDLDKYITKKINGN
jgi:hypothetical protein